MTMLTGLCLTGVMFTTVTVGVSHVSMQTFIINTTHKVQLSLMGMSSFLQVFGHKPKYLTNQNYDLIMVLKKVKGSTITFHPEGNMAIHPIVVHHPPLPLDLPKQCQAQRPF